VGSFFSYLFESSAITLLVLLMLSIYFVTTFWVFLARHYVLVARISSETKSLRALYTSNSELINSTSLLYPYIARVSIPNEAILKAASLDAVRASTKGLTSLSVIASTSPFIGLFGTVIGILETFSKLGTQTSASLSVVAPAISEALIATAAGIAVAIFAYTFHLLLKRKAYELSSLLSSQSEVILSKLKEKRQ